MKGGGFLVNSIKLSYEVVDGWKSAASPLDRFQRRRDDVDDDDDDDDDVRVSDFPTPAPNDDDDDDDEERRWAVCQTPGVRPLDGP